MALPEPGLLQHAHHVAADRFGDVTVGVFVLHQPADDVRERLGRVLDPVDVLDLRELLRAVRRADRQLLGEVATPKSKTGDELARLYFCLEAARPDLEPGAGKTPS